MPALRWVAMIRGLDQLRVQGEERGSFLEVCTSHFAITLTRLIPEILSHPGIVISGRTSPYASCRSMGPVEAEGEDDFAVRGKPSVAISRSIDGLARNGSL